MTVKELIQTLNNLDQEKEVLISCEGGCVIEGDINVYSKNDNIILEIE